MTKCLKICTFYDEWRKKWRLRFGCETFYDENNVMREWDTEQEALEWLAGLTDLPTSRSEEESRLPSEGSIKIEPGGPEMQQKLSIEGDISGPGQ